MEHPFFRGMEEGHIELIAGCGKNEHYDEGTIIFQASTDVSSDDTPESLAEKIHQLEYEHFPKVVESLLSKND